MVAIQRYAAIAALAALCAASPARADEEPREAVITKSTKVYAHPRKRADVELRVSVNDKVMVVKTGRKWVKIEAGGKRGWIRKSRVHVFKDGWRRDDAVVIPDRIDDGGGETGPEEIESSAPVTPPRQDGLAGELRASLGFVSFASEFDSDGGTALGAYEISAGAMGAGIGGRAVVRRGKLLVGIDGGYRVAVGAPGIRFHRDDGSVAGANRFYIHDLDGAAIAGFAVDRDIDVAARAGVHAGQFWIGELQDNPGLIARERLVGPTAGLELAARLSPKLRFAANLDVLVNGSLHQTANLEDGMDSAVRGVSGGARVSYSLDGIDLEASYLARRTWLEFSGPSARLDDVTTAERTDQTHALAIAASRRF